MTDHVWHRLLEKAQTLLFYPGVWASAPEFIVFVLFTFSYIFWPVSTTDVLVTHVPHLLLFQTLALNKKPLLLYFWLSPIRVQGCLSRTSETLGKACYPKDFILACFGANGLIDSGASLSQNFKHKGIHILSDQERAVFAHRGLI